MSELRELLQSLRANYIVVVENEFQYVTNPSEILGLFVDLSDGIKERLLASLPQSISKQFKAFDDSFNSVSNHNDELKTALLPVDLNQYLVEIENEDIFPEDLIRELIELLENDSTDDIKEVFLRNGILNTPQVTPPIYDQIINELKKIPSVQLTFYKSYIPHAQRSEFEKVLESGISETDSVFWLAIVDKMLGVGDTGEQGKDLIKYFQRIGSPFLGFILSSKAEDKEPKKYQDYFLREISKGDDVLLETMTQRLAQAAYAEVFHRLNVAVQESSQKAEETVLLNQKNIKHIVELSNNEGIPASSAVKNWFKGALEMHLSHRESEMHKFIGGLTNFFDSNYLPNHPNLEDISEELQAINIAEIFDYNINQKHEFPAPGDIFYDGQNYFVLTGQSCELLLRIDNDRQAHVAELIKAEFDPTRSIDKKLEVTQTNNQFTIEIQNFKHVNGQIGVLKVNVNTTVIAQFEVLDSCAFNEEGECTVHTDDSLDPEIVAVLPKAKEEHYKKIQADVQKLIELKKQIDALPKNLFSHFYSGINDFEYDEDRRVVDFGLKRVCRIKDDFNKYVTNSYNNYRGRIDLNQIHQTQRRTKIQKLKFGFPGQDKKTIDFEIHEEGQDVYILRNKLLESLDEEYHGSLQLLPEKVKLNYSGSEFKFSKNSEFYELTLHYFIEKDGTPKSHNRPGINGFQLNRGAPPDSWATYGFDSENLNQEWGDNFKEQLSIAEVIGSENGIYVNQGNTRIFLDKGIIRIEKRNEQENED